MAGRRLHLIEAIESLEVKDLSVLAAIPSGPVAKCGLIRPRRSATSSGVMSKKERSLKETARASMEKLGRGDVVLKHEAKKSLRSVALSTSDKADFVPFLPRLWRMTEACEANTSPKLFWIRS